MDKDAINNLWNWVDSHYVQPEVQRRRDSNSIPTDFKIYQLRILMPNESPAIVQFNDEIGWSARAIRGDGKELTIGAPVYLHELDRVDYVSPPEVDGKRVAFIFFGWDGTQYRGFFDFSPNWPKEEIIANELKENGWSLGSSIAQFLQEKLQNETARICIANKDIIQGFGLWLIPSLIPYPLAQIAVYLSENNTEAAKELFVSHCNSDFIGKLVSKWWAIQEINDRRSLIEEAIWAHQNKKYHLSVSTLLPHLEGILVHWEFNKGMTARFRTESRIRDFSNVTLPKTDSPFLYKSIHSNTIDFILDGPVLSTFQNWQDSLDPAFPNRHAVGHGRYDSSLFDEMSSIKVFLLLDTIKDLIAAQLDKTSGEPITS